MWYKVTIDLRERDCYQAMSLEAISEKDWVYTGVDHDSKRTIDEWRRRHTP